MNLFDIYHQQTKRLNEVVKDSPAKEDWPESWRTTYIKSYPRFEAISLPEPTELQRPLSDCILARRSHRDFECNVSIDEISTLLFFSIGEKDSKFDNEIGRRMYPSGGARYPLEFYLVNFKEIKDLPAGVFHYNLQNHSLNTLIKRQFTLEDRLKISSDAYTNDAQFAIFGTAILSRSVEKYGERAYRYANLELGAVTQNFALACEAMGISSINVGGFYDDEVESLLDIDGMSEKVLHSMFFG